MAITEVFGEKTFQEMQLIENRPTSNELQEVIRNIQALRELVAQVHRDSEKLPLPERVMLRRVIEVKEAVGEIHGRAFEMQINLG
jgi:hypothetical protein